LESEPK
jgi:hypothetical protein